MLPTDPVTYKTPDGVERQLRFTLGARKRIAIALPGCGSDVNIALNMYGDGALPEIAYACMFDEDGDPPADLTAARLAESLDGDDTMGLMAAVMSAATKGRTPKNEIEAMLKKVQEAGAKKRGGKRTGITSGASHASASGSQPANSGASQSGNSTHSASDSKSVNGSPTTEAA